MRVFGFHFLIFLFMAPVSVRAEVDSCSSIRLDDQGGAMEHVDVRDQQQIGDCYAVAASQFFDAWRFKHGDVDYGNQSSGFEINQRYKIYRDKKIQAKEIVARGYDHSINGGELEKIIPFLVKEGTCSQAGLNQMFKYGLTVDQYASRILKIYEEKQEKFYQEMAQLRQDLEPQGNAMGIPAPAIDRLKRDFSQVIRAEDARLRRQAKEEGIVEYIDYNSTWLGVSYDNRRLEKIQANRDTVAIFDTIGNIRCEKKIKVARPFSVTYHEQYHWAPDHVWPVGGLLNWRPVYHEGETRKLIHDELNQGLKRAMPIGIGYCSSIFKKGRAFKTRNQFKEAGCGRHASLIIGRQRNGDKCQFLIRNSWGKSCSGYHSDWSCDSKAGSVWIDEETLGKAIYEVETVKR